MDVDAPAAAALLTPLILIAGSTFWLFLRVESCLDEATVEVIEW